MVSVYKRGDILYIQYELNGKNIQKSTKLKDTKENRRLLEYEVIPVLTTKLLNNEFDIKKPKLFQEYSIFYLREKKHLKTIKTLTNQVDVINQYFKNKRIDTLTRYDIKMWVQERLETNTPKTVNNYLSIVRGIINVAIDMEIIKNNVAENIKLPTHIKKDIEPFSSIEVKKLLSSADEYFLKYFLAISFYTGMRTGEVLALMQSDINLETKTISIKRALTDGEIGTPKTLKSIREVPILNDLVPFLNEMKKTSTWLFPKKDGLHYSALGGHHKKEWRKLLKECDISYRKIYVTRHTFIVSMLKNSDLSIMEIAQIVGHTSTQMIIQNYAKFIKGEHLKIDRDLTLFTDS